MPPIPAEKVCVSSINNKDPYFVANSLKPSKNPGSGRTIPIFVKAGSVIITATSPFAKAFSTLSKSLNSATLVVSLIFPGAPTFPGRKVVSPFGPLTTNVSSTVP